MDDGQRANLFQAKKVLMEMFDKGDIAKPVLYRGIFEIAAELGLAGRVEEAMAELHQIPSTYFVEDAPVQMRQDPALLQTAVKFYRALKAEGLVDLELGLTMKPARA